MSKSLSTSCTHHVPSVAALVCFLCMCSKCPCLSLHPVYCVRHYTSLSLHPVYCVRHYTSLGLHPVYCVLHYTSLSLHPVYCVLHYTSLSPSCLQCLKCPSLGLHHVQCAPNIKAFVYILRTVGSKCQRLSLNPAYSVF